MYGIWSSAWASNRRSSHLPRVRSSAGADAMIFTSASTALLTAVPMAPDELSTCSSAGETFSRKSTAPSTASTLFVRPIFLISETASLMRLMAGCDLQPKA